MRKWKSCLVFCVLAILIGGGVFPGLAEGQYGGELDFGLSLTITTLDPGFATGTYGQTIRKVIWESLVERQEDGTIVPGLAVDWEVSDDGLRWTFYLRDGVKFHDGTEMTAEDVKASLDRLLNPDLALPRSRDLAMLDSVEVVDSHTVVLVLAYPFAPFLAHLSMDFASIMSKATLDEFGYEMEQVGWKPVGTGPFKYHSHVPEESIRVERFEDYWGERPYLDAIVFRSIPEASTRLALLETGALDIVEMVPPFDMPRLVDDPNIEALSLPGNRVAHIGMNCQKPPFDDARVRQAMNYAVDIDAILEGLLAGFAHAADSIVASGVSGYASVPMYEYNSAKARELLAAAGYPDGVSFTLWTPQGRYFMDKEVTEALQAQLREVGLNASVQVIDWTTYLAILRYPLDRTETQAYFLGWEVGTNHIAQLLDMVFATNAWPPSWNTMFYSNEQVDALTLEAKQSADLAESERLYAQVQQMIMEDAPWVPLFVYDQLFASQSGVKGMWAWPSGVAILRGVWME